MTLLHISSSPRGTDSESLRIARVFTDAYAESHPGAEVEHWDLWDGPLPDMALGRQGQDDRVRRRHTRRRRGAACGRRPAPRSSGSPRPTGCCSACRCGTAGIPYVLKQFIDVVSQPGWIFGVDPVTGYQHLLAGRGTRVAVVYTSAVWGPALGPEFGRDFQSTYFADWLRWTGLTDISEIRFHPTLTGDRAAEDAAALARARDVAKTF